jgi:hypothetical protein
MFFKKYIRVVVFEHWRVKESRKPNTPNIIYFSHIC